MLLRGTYLFPQPHEVDKSVEGREGKPYMPSGGAKPVPKITRAGSVRTASSAKRRQVLPVVMVKEPNRGVGWRRAV